MKALIGKSKDTNISIPFETFKKHFIALGSSGSGKTVMCKVIIEEAAKNHIPSIIIDPQGDLASLAINSEKINAKVMIYTPTSSKGIPLSLNPLKLPQHNLEKEELISIINTISSSLCKLLGYNLDNDKGRSAQTFMYKILEQAHQDNQELQNFNDLIEIIKTKESEFISKKEISKLVQKLKFLTIGEKELLFNFGEPLNIKSLLKNDISIIYLNTLNSTQDKDFFLSILTTKLYEHILENPSNKLQSLFYIDEISTYLPAGNRKTLSKPILNLLYKQARKYGLGCIVSTQNPGDIDYKAFSQFSTWAIGRLTTKQDREKLKTSLKSIAGNKINILEENMPKLKPGEFLLFSPDIFEDINKIKVRWLETEHKTLTTNDISKIMQTHSKNIHNQIKKTKLTTKKGKKHIAIQLSQEQINKLINKNKKKLFKFFGPDKERIDFVKLKFIPFYNTIIKIKTSKLLRIKKDIKEHKIFFNSITGNPYNFIKDKFKKFEGFNHLINLSENELHIVKLLNKKDNISTNEIAFKLKKSASSTNNQIKSLFEKKIITYDKKENINIWSLLIKVNVPNPKKLESSPGISEKSINAEILNPKIDINKLNKLVRTWFGTAEIISHEIIYYPVYEIKYLSKKGSRNLTLSAVNGAPFS
ncbi:MAG: helicase HerA-like domain-containing protein [Nanoarchaeota archaeon]|nr:helicase HerA-like domain-containing protein [Nanoarchaeota archaeon]